MPYRRPKRNEGSILYRVQGNQNPCCELSKNLLPPSLPFLVVASVPLPFFAAALVPFFQFEPAYPAGQGMLEIFPAVGEMPGEDPVQHIGQKLPYLRAAAEFTGHIATADF